MIHLSRSFKAILVVIIIAIALLSSVYYFTQVSPKPKLSSHIKQPATFYLTNLTVTPSATKPNQPVSISVNVQNVGEESGNYSTALWINGNFEENQNLTLAAGQNSNVTFMVTKSNPGIYTVWIGNLTSTFTIETPPTATPAPITQPTQVSGGGGGVVIGGGGSSGGTGGSGGTRTWTSCPTLFVWNGTGYTRASEVSDGPGWMGFVDHYNADGTITFAYSDPWSYIKLNPKTLGQRDNFYDMTITEQSDEIFYLDSVKVLAVDHSPDVDVYSTRGTYPYNLSNQGTIYTVSKNSLKPLSALNNGEDVLSLISTLDGDSTTAIRWSWNTLELNLGDLSNATTIKLKVNAMTNWPTNEQGGNWATQFSSKPGVTPSPPPYMEVKAANGSWVKVVDSRQFPIPPVDPSTFVVDLSGLFLTNDYSLRINYYQNYTFDYIGVELATQQNLSMHEINPSSANLYQEFATCSNSTGNFTRYGDVLNLVSKADDIYVIGRQGDSIKLEFQDANPVPPEEVRDYFVVASAWFKGQRPPLCSFHR